MITSLSSSKLADRAFVDAMRLCLGLDPLYTQLPEASPMRELGPTPWWTAFAASKSGPGKRSHWEAR